MVERVIKMLRFSDVRTAYLDYRNSGSGVQYRPSLTTGFYTGTESCFFWSNETLSKVVVDDRRRPSPASSRAAPALRR
jgi:hypothetical protein